MTPTQKELVEIYCQFQSKLKLNFQIKTKFQSFISYGFKIFNYNFRFFWRIVVDNEKDAAVAIIQLNNPFVNETQLTNEDKLCPDVTDKITWLTELKKDPTLRKDPSVGYTYSCEVAELEKVVPFLPSLGPGINLLI